MQWGVRTRKTDMELTFQPIKNGTYEIEFSIVVWFSGSVFSYNLPRICDDQSDRRYLPMVVLVSLDTPILAGKFVTVSDQILSRL